MKNYLLKMTSILILLTVAISAISTVSLATDTITVQPTETFTLDKEYIEVEAGKTANFTVTSNQFQEFYIVSENEAVCTIFDPQGSTVLTSEFKLEATTKTFAVSGTAPGETVVKVNSGYQSNDDGTGTYNNVKEIRVVVKQNVSAVTNEDIPYTGTEDIIFVIGLVMVVMAVIFIKLEVLNKDMKR